MGVFKNDVGRPSNKTLIIRRVLKIVISIIVIGIVFLAGYFFNGSTGKSNTDSNNNSKNSNKDVTTTTTVNSQELDISSKEVVDLFIPFSYYTHEASDEELYSKDKITPDDLSSEYKNRLAFAYYYNVVGYDNLYEGESKHPIADITTSYLTSNTLEKYYKLLFGSNVEYVAKTFSSYNIDELSMTYNDETNVYNASFVAGDWTYYRYGKELYKAIKVGNKIELYEYVVVYNSCDYVIGVYSNISDANNCSNPIKEKTASNSEELLEHMDDFMKYSDVKISEDGVYLEDLSDYKDKASKYKLTFEKENDNYIFKKIEKID